MSPDISIVVPVYNEEKNIPILFQEICEAMDRSSFKYEIIFIDDGSTDRSAQELKNLKKASLHCIFFNKHLGKSSALSHGFKSSQGNIIITLDGDLQDDPQEISHFIQKINEGYDLVSGWKLDRQDAFNKKLASRIFNTATSLITGLKLHDIGSGFKAYRRGALDGIHLFQGAHRFLPVFVQAKGLRITEIRYHHRIRFFGHSKFGISRMLEGMVGLIRIIWLIRIKSLFKKS